MDARSRSFIREIGTCQFVKPVGVHKIQECTLKRYRAWYNFSLHLNIRCNFLDVGLGLETLFILEGGVINWAWGKLDRLHTAMVLELICRINIYIF